MSSRRMDLVGQKFGRLRVIGYSGESRTRSMFSCECDCGEICIVLGNRLKNGHTKSCGCYSRDIQSMVHKIHGLSNGKDQLYSIWRTIKARCSNQNTWNYNRYGGRGISICDEWKDDPKNFIEWCRKNGYKQGLSIDRKDNDGNYEPDNCKFSTPKEQARNRRNTVLHEFNGESKTIAEWAEVLGYSVNTLATRYARGDTGDALFRSITRKGSN